ncbi:MAG: hypothetical protein HOL15_09935 [Nitrospinaceae bacterium]|jgi:hypothetical protein|nr:hypothetical protein [Nitrospina sp.]MBT5377121.1 hypothetical protein [Nitrospinaceae bacterium]MBT5869534.1 hypothetical protein [Nitrospinaceae bacterium]MBT6346062.1 hypothetical protein [Nitrospina sp.]
MGSLWYYLGKTLQLIGLATISAVVFMFFTQMSMEPLLIWSLVGVSEFYGGTWLLGKAEG